MAYLKTILRGSLGTVEVFSTSNSWGFFGIVPDTPNQEMVDQIAARLRTFTIPAQIPAGMRLLLSTAGELTSWRIELHAENETILSVAEILLISAIPGTGSPNKTPQDALVFSLRTSTPGARGRGRMYWPALQATLSASFQITAPVPATLAAEMRTWLNAIGGEMNAYFISIASAIRVVLAVRSITDHVSRDINTIQVGSILDTQRRRRDNIPEAYVAVPYP